MIDRREVLAGAAAFGLWPAAAARAALPVPPGNRLGFDIVRKGTTLGSHVLTFDRGAGKGDLVVHVAVDLIYKIGPITLYHYRHNATETWAGEQVVALETMTNDNGTRYHVTGKREGAGFAVQADKLPRYIAPADALPATHWNRRELDVPWINTQDGTIARPKVAPRGVETIPTANGGSVRARHFNLSGDVQLDMYYEDGGGWAGLSFVKSGTEIRYVRQT